MNVETSFLKDRPAQAEELKDLPDTKPVISGPGRYEDLFSVDAALNLQSYAPEDFYANMERWSFRLN